MHDVGTNWFSHPFLQQQFRVSNESDFHKIVADTAANAPAEAVIVERLRAGRNHPLKLSFPEGEYLKGLALRKV
ncbi:MAG: hypothetical protein ING36_05020 [Burkholderiales bacterium]|nr:hypothetical protein [Burkholderiales bacterium]MCA3174895.1 hypothetical protein [Burkholderiales bacterium]